MEEEKGYNGWTNYETWNVAQWFDNDSSEYWRERAQEFYNDAESDETFTRDERAALDLADAMEEEVNENTPTVTGMYADLLNASIGSVNWHEIAAHYIEDVDKDEEQTESA